MNLALKGGLELCGWRLPKGKGCGRVWISRGLIRRKLSEKSLATPHPSSYCVLYLYTECFQTHSKVHLCFRVWPQAERFCSWSWGCIFTQRKHRDHLISSGRGEDICSYSKRFDSEVSGYSMAMYSHLDTIQSVKLDVCRSLCFWSNLFWNW